MRHRFWMWSAAALATAALTLLPHTAEAQRRAPSSGRPITGPVTGRAVPRAAVPGRPGYPSRPIYPGRPIYGSPGYGYPGYGYGYPGYGYGYCCGYPYYPYYPGVGFSIGFSFGYPWYGYGPAYPAYGGGYYPAMPYGGIRIDIPQRDAEVYVEGAYVGVVDEFDGTFQQLNLEPGNHQIEIRAPGREPVMLDVRITPGRTMTYRNDLKPQR
jgi:hypothetical protein